jgi:hypothetical protein
MAEAVAPGDYEIARATDDSMDHQPVVELKHHYVAGLDGGSGAMDFEQVAGLHAGEHAAAGDRQARLAEGR